MDHYQKVKIAGCIGKKLGRGNIDYEDRGIFNGLFHAATMKLCSSKSKKRNTKRKEIF